MSRDTPTGLKNGRDAYQHSNEVHLRLHNVGLVLKGLDRIVSVLIEEIPHGHVKDEVEVMWAIVETCVENVHKLEGEHDKITAFLSDL